MVTPEEYYENEESHGNYQYVSLDTIISDLEIDALEEDNYLKNTKRYRLVQQAKVAIKLLNQSTANDVLSLEITVPETLVFALPQDYLNYVVVSVVVVDSATGSKRLEPLDINKNMNISTGILQDDNGDPLFDQNGKILTSDGDNAYGAPYKKIAFAKLGGQFALDASKLSMNGEFIIDEKRGKMLFSSELMNKEIVFDYISDGLQANLTDDEIRVHKQIVEPIKDWVYYACIAGKRTVPANEKLRALNRYKTTLHEAKMIRADFNFLQIARVARSQSKNI